MTTATSSCPSDSTPEATSPGGAWSARRIELADVRRWRRVEFGFSDGVTVLVGPNGAGKTTVIEALTFACLGVSPRTRSEGEMLRHGAEALWVGLEIEGPAGVETRSIGYAPRRGRRLQRDGVAVRGLGDWRRRGAVLVFLPDELRSVKGPPAARRRSLDRLLEAAEPGYADDLTGYQRAVAQRNALLRRVRAGQASPDGLAPWEAQMVALGASVARARRAAARALEPLFRTWMDRLGGGPDATLRVESSPSELAQAPDAEIGEALAAAWDARRDRDHAAAQTTAGPHRDDVWIGRGDHDLRRLGSQGEQRLAALALLLGHRDHLSDRGPTPIMLLDDVLSELDPSRRDALLEAVGDGGQTIVTTADPAAAASAAERGAHVVEVGQDGA